MESSLFSAISGNSSAASLLEINDDLASPFSISGLRTACAPSLNENILRTKLSLLSHNTHAPATASKSTIKSSLLPYFATNKNNRIIHDWEGKVVKIQFQTNIFNVNASNIKITLKRISIISLKNSTKPTIKINRMSFEMADQQTLIEYSNLTQQASNWSWKRPE